MNAPAPRRVLVVARRPLARAGLRGLLAERDDVLVVAERASIGEVEQSLLDLRPDVMLADYGPGDAEQVAALAQWSAAIGAPLVLIGSAPMAADLQAALRAGARGFLLANATAEDLAATLQAAAQGLLVLDPLLGRTLAAATLPAPPENFTASEPLTEREHEVLQLLALGLPNKTIATRLGISDHTVKFHVGSIMAKLGATSRTEAVTRAVRQGLLAL